MTDLTERLRGHVTYSYVPNSVRACMDEAADLIEAQRARIAELEAAVREMAGV